MRACVALLVLLAVEGCTNDYGTFRFPKGEAPLVVSDAGDAGANDGG